MRKGRTAAPAASWIAAFWMLAAPAAALGQDGMADVADTGDTAWILAASAFALMMALPGLVLRYGGMVRAKNALSVGLQCAAAAAAVSVLWIMAGYTMAFGEVRGGWFGGGWLGAGNAWMLIDLGNARNGYAIPESAFVLFQMTFAVVAAALMAGAWAGRARFGWVVGFCALWSLAVYAPIAHWIWGGGWLAAKVGTLDFAGGIVVHTAAGVSALVAALLLGRRQGFPSTAMPPHSPALAMAGAAILWVGWLGMSGGAALTANDDAAAAAINTHIAASAAALVWLLAERFSSGKPTATGFATGAIAGLATVSPAAGLVSPGAALILGALAAGVCYPAIRIVKRKLEIDDSLDVFAVHGAGGIAGSLALAVFLSPALGGTGYAAGMSMGSQLAAQAFGVGVAVLWSAVATAILAILVSFIVPMRVSEDEENAGLDMASHGERAWNRD